MRERKIWEILGRWYQPAILFRTFLGLSFVCAFTCSPVAAPGAPPKISAEEKAVIPPGDPATTLPLTLHRGTPLNVILAHRVPIGHKGEPVEGRLVQPLYAFDRMAAPEGTKVLGHVTEVKSVPRMQRVQAIMHGDFTPLRTTQVEFDTLVLKDGRHIPIQTRVSPGTGEVVHLEVVGPRPGKRASLGARAASAVENAKRQLQLQKNQVMADVKLPGRGHRLKDWLLAQLPYHRQFLPTGARFTASLEAPVRLGQVPVTASELKLVGTTLPDGAILDAVLLTPLSSATSQRGTPVEALVTHPVFSSKHQLVIPVGSTLEGAVVQAQPARRMAIHRNGILRFTFRRIQVPHGIPRPVIGTLQGIEVDKKENVKLDAEGGAHSTTSKMTYAKPALAVLIAASSARPDIDVRPGRVYTDNSGPASGQILGGGLGYKLMGMAMALAVHYQPVTAGFAAYGAAWSVYSHWLARGQEVVFPKDTPIEIRLGERRPASRSTAHHAAPQKL